MFEIDAAWPTRGPIELAVDVKRIEARRDIHKRTDEIVNKAQKLNAAYPGAAFGAVIYYPFLEEHGNVRDRLSSPHIVSVQFASESPQSIENAAQLMIAKLRDAHAANRE